MADAIEQVYGAHRVTCDLAGPRSPQATVALLRVGPGRVDYLMLADSHLILGMADERLDIITDVREVEVRRECTARLDGLEPGSSQHDVALAACREDLRSHRNQPGGYWIAKDDPQAAEQAVTGGVSLTGLRDAALLSNGATRLVDPYAATTWPALLERCRSDGPDAVLDDLRRHEAAFRTPGPMTRPSPTAPSEVQPGSPAGPNRHNASRTYGCLAFACDLA